MGCGSLESSNHIAKYDRNGNSFELFLKGPTGLGRKSCSQLRCHRIDELFSVQGTDIASPVSWIVLFTGS
ncbi:hypothetical protein MUK42_30158 [Musa troglodytarum]|uniref:Uncharacterized protein n=1 Tax=Musa troglodytarum TaxID=320322 RepID=A0A9E7JYC8_9LILI|nr:hypothetical protein MUK42_30158 [Musa troglodytarum]